MSEESTCGWRGGAAGEWGGQGVGVSTCEKVLGFGMPGQDIHPTDRWYPLPKHAL